MTIRFLVWIAYLSSVIVARLISWWERKPYAWGDQLVAQAFIAWCKAQDETERERSIREWD